MNRLRPVKCVVGLDEQAMHNDPSAIFPSLRVIRPDIAKSVPEPQLPITYATLDPFQRWIYLNWLQDVSKPVPGKHVLLYHYGLERHLLYGDFDGAFEEIMFLRKKQSDLHFRSASIMSLLWACSRKKKWELIAPLLSDFDDHYYGCNVLLTYMFHAEIDLSYDMLFKLRPRFTAKVNTRYIHKNPELYIESLRSILIEKYGQPSYPLRNLTQFQNLERIKERAFSNPSIPYKDRFAIFYNFKHDHKFNDEIGEILAAAHERTKTTLRRGEG